MDKEKWADIKGFEGLYQVSTLGRIRSYTRVVNKRTYYGKIMSPVVKRTTNGKPCGLCVRVRDVARSNKQIGINVAKTVLETFVGEPIGDAKQVRHKNGNALDNTLQNLEWDCSSALYAERNEKARKLFDEEAFGIVKGICYSRYKIYNPWMYGMYDTDDLIQDCLLSIWKVIDLYDENKCTFYTFCKMKVDWVFCKLYEKWKRRNVLCQQVLYGDMEAVEEEITAKRLGICKKKTRRD